jgi:hypothetical protein
VTLVAPLSLACAYNRIDRSFIVMTNNSKVANHIQKFKIRSHKQRIKFFNLTCVLSRILYRNRELTLLVVIF